jgi:hypothetical protein
MSWKPWKPDFSPMAKAVAELINSKPRSPSLEELQTLLRKGYLELLLAHEERMLPIEMCVEAIEPMPLRRADEFRVLINAKPTSPTIAEMMNVLSPPRPDVPAVYLWDGKRVTREEQQRLHAEALRIAADQHLEECACDRCLEDLETAYKRSAAYYIRYLERIGHEPHPEYPEAELWVLARRLAAAAAPVVVW